MRRTSTRLFFSQHRTPILPQSPIDASVGASLDPLRVAYFLYRNPVVRHDPHPIETEYSFLLEREHQRYARHEVESSTHFLQSKGQSMDVLGRQDPAQITANFFNIEMYQDSSRAVCERYKTESRVAPLDLWDPVAQQDLVEPPARHSLQRRLDDYLFFIVREESSGKWMLPYEDRAAHETLRMTVDRALQTQHSEAVDFYVWSNSPQAVVKSPPAAAAPTPSTFVYCVTYLSGRPKFNQVNPKISDHAWVTRKELRQYSDHFATGVLDVLLDVAPCGAFENS